MSVMSDNWIKRQCTRPTHRVYVGPNYKAEYAWAGITHSQETLDMHVDRYHGHVVDGAEALPDWAQMITPFVPHQVREVPVPSTAIIESDGSVKPVMSKIVSYGVSSFGYDVRLDRKFKIFSNTRGATIDPLNPTEDCYVEHEGDYCIIPPNSYILGSTIEYFDIPRDVMVICVGKSTYARLAAIVNVTPIEPCFKGNVVIEIANCSTLPLKVYANQGISQFMFFKGDRPCDVSYADRGGKYQGQTGVTTARL